MWYHKSGTDDSRLLTYGSAMLFVAVHVAVSWLKVGLRHSVLETDVRHCVVRWTTWHPSWSMVPTTTMRPIAGVSACCCTSCSSDVHRSRMTMSRSPRSTFVMSCTICHRSYRLERRISSTAYVSTPPKAVHRRTHARYRCIACCAVRVLTGSLAWWWWCPYIASATATALEDHNEGDLSTPMADHQRSSSLTHIAAHSHWIPTDCWYRWRYLEHCH
jgi:hypothetical protein